MNQESVPDLPESLTMQQAFQAAHFMIQIYGDVEAWRSEELALLHQYMESDPARWSDFKAAVAKALAHPDAAIETMWHGPRDSEG